MSVATIERPAQRAHGKICRCRYCRSVRVQQTRSWRRRRDAGAVFWVDAEPVRAHVLNLMTVYRMPADTIAAQVGVSHGTVRNLLYGNGAPPSRRMVAENGRRLLGAHFDLDILRDATLINPAGTRRRVQGMIVAGYCIAEQARRLGRGRDLYRTVLADTVRADLARAVRDLADDLETVPPPNGTRAQRSALSKALGMARAHPEWVALAAWDDIDDPNALPYDTDYRDTLPDEVAVARIMTGVDSIKDLREVDIYAAVTQIFARGGSFTTLSERLRCNGQMARRIAERAAIYELLAHLDARGQLELRLLRCLGDGVVHIAAAAVLDMCTDAALTLCPYVGDPAAAFGSPGSVRPVERVGTGVLCWRCRKALGPFAPRIAL